MPLSSDPPFQDYVVELDLDRDGVFEEEITPYVAAVETVTGRNQPSQLTGKAAPGRLQAVVMNDDARFSDFNTESPYFDQLLPGVGIRFRDRGAVVLTPDKMISDNFRRASLAGDFSLGAAQLGGTWVGTPSSKTNHRLWAGLDKLNARPAAGHEIANNLPITSLTSLVGHWPLQEADGNRADLSGSGNTLVPTGSPVPGQATGPGSAYPMGASFASGSGRLQIADNASLSMGDITMEVTAWVKLDSKAATGTVAGKWLNPSSGEYWLAYDQGADRFRFVVSNNGTAFTAVNADVLGSPEVGRWYFLSARHDPVGNTITIQVNNGVANQVAHTTGIFNGTAGFAIGAEADGTFPLAGTVAGVTVWKRNLTTTERTLMYTDGPYLATLTAVNPNDGFNDCYIQARVHPGTPPLPTSPFPQQVGVVFRYLNSENYTFAVVDAGQSSLRLIVRAGGVDTSIASVPIEVYDGMSIGVLTVGSLCTVYLEGVQLLKSTLADSGSTGVGLYAKCGEASLRPYVSLFEVWSHTAAEQGRGPQLCENPSFEQDTAGWAATGPCSIARSLDWSEDGVASLKVTASGTLQFGPRYNRGLTAGTRGRRFAVSGMVRVAPGDGAIGNLSKIHLYETGGIDSEREQQRIISASIPAGETLFSFAIEIENDDRTALGVAFTMIGNSGDIFYVDDVKIEEMQAEVPGVFWTGFVDEVVPSAQAGQVHTATITASGPLSFAARPDVVAPVSVAGRPTGLLIGKIMGDIGFLNPPGEIAQGDVVTGAFVEESGGALALMQKVEETEFGFLHETQEGQLAFRSRSHRDAIVVPAVALSDDPFDGNFNYQSIQQQSWVGDIFNRVEVGVSPYSEGAEATLWTDNTVRILEAGQYADLEAKYADGFVARWTGHQRVIANEQPAIHANVPVTNQLSTAGTTHPVTMVTTVDADDLLWIAYWQHPLAGCDINTPSGWTQILPGTPILGFAFFVKRAVGNEDSTVVNVTTRGATSSLAAAGRVTNWAGKFGTMTFEQTIKIVQASGTNKTPNPPQVDWDWGRLPTLVYAIAAAVNDLSSTPPAGMSETFDSQMTGTQDMALAVANATVTAERYNPGSFSYISTVGWQAFTIAIRGADIGTYVPEFSTPQGQDGHFRVDYVGYIGGTYQRHEQIQATGIPLVKGDEVSVIVEDIDSQERHGPGTAVTPITYRNSAKLFKTAEDATTYGNLVLARYKDRHPTLNMVLIASQDSAYYEQAKLRRVGDRVTVIANDALGSGLGIEQDFFIENIAHQVARGGHAMALELSTTQTPGPIGEVIPVLIHFNATAPQITRFSTGLAGAMTDANAWFASHCDGQTMTFGAVQVINAAAQGKNLAGFQADAWGQFLGTLDTAGGDLDPWQSGFLHCALVVGLPYTTGGLGGAGAPNADYGEVVKDGDALEIFSKWHADGGVGTTFADYDVNLGMWIHELMHGMSANNHEDVDGFNAEMEWWEGASNIAPAPVNRGRMLAGIWLSP